MTLVNLSGLLICRVCIFVHPILFYLLYFLYFSNLSSQYARVFVFVCAGLNHSHPYSISIRVNLHLWK